MSNNITPPPELVEQWVALLPQGSMKAFTAAAQWGADQELEACCSLIDLAHSDPAATGDHRLVDKTVLLKQLRAARRPEPQGPSNQELYDYWIGTSPEFGCADPVGFARAVLARWGRPAIEPVP
jgi:hypothetical protein